MFIFAAPSLFAQDFPRLEASPKAAEYGRKAESGLSWEDLAEISLWASGAADPYAPAARGRPSYMEIIRDAAAELQSGGRLPSGERGKGEYVLDFMFGKFLKRYSEKQTGIDTLLSNGTYNCVSSAVLYVILAESAGLSAGGVITRDHAFAGIFSAGEKIDVETTNPHGFDPGNRRDFHDAFGRLTGFAYVPPGNYRDRVDISPLELVSLIFNNRISDLESRNRFGDALGLALDREALLASPSGGNRAASAGARRDTRNGAVSPGRDLDPELFVEPGKMVMDRISNYGAMLIRQGRDEDALKWADLAAASRPDGNGESRWDELAAAALNNLLAKLIQAGRFEEARDTLDANAKRLTPLVSARLSVMRKNLAASELSALAEAVKNTADADSVLEILSGNPQGLEPENLRELLIFIALKKGEFTAKEQGWKAAAAFAENAASEYGPDPRFEEQRRSFIANRIAELHNSFAELFNRRDFEAAQKIILGALEEFPGERRFLSDRELVERMLR